MIKEQCKKKTDEAVGAISEGMSEALDDAVNAVKKKAMEKVGEVVADKDLQEAVNAIVAEAVGDAVIIGRAAGFKDERLDSVIGFVMGAVSKAVSPTDAERADKYKLLFYHQRLVGYHLEQALQAALAQVCTYESGVSPFTSPLAATFSGVGDIKECQLAKDR